ncbi:putative bark agglutinin LECRPA3 [Abrus precatorius]|uniref:Bark agglutinin LECRPA3 n=1 Tax=Abrus precatorius TaxID=3816 RepID=A0A8B8MEU7_ABRPR|nr:putative bark agglutinin LECRPA3 [Abrus precatorius]
MATQKSFSLLLVTFTTLHLLLARNVNSAKVLSFNFTKFTTGSSSITLQGNAEILANGVLALTSHTNSATNVGCALYTTPVTIWDETTGNVASCVSSISLVLRDIQGFMEADGVVFFLAPSDTVIPNNSSGGKLGIVDHGYAFNNFVGVELDNCVNDWDPNYPHIGIDVNSLISLKTVKFNRVSGSLVKVSIIYDSLSKTLSVSVTYENNRIATVSQVVDLKAVLPSRVRVGLSASTSSGGAQLHDIHSWSFTSNLETTVSSVMENVNIASYA